MEHNNKDEETTIYKHQARSIKGWGAWGGGGGYLVVVANIFLNFTYIKVNGHVVGPPLFGENINNWKEQWNWCYRYIPYPTPIYPGIRIFKILINDFFLVVKIFVIISLPYIKKRCYVPAHFYRKLNCFFRTQVKFCIKFAAESLLNCLRWIRLFQNNGSNMATKYWTVQMCCFLTFTVCDIAVLKFYLVCN